MALFPKIFIGVTLMLELIMTFEVVQVQGQMASDPNCPCTVDQSDMQSGKFYDTCTIAGTFKSKSTCYQNGPTGKQVEPYEYYTCVPYGTSFILYPRKCNLPWTVVLDPSLAPAIPAIFFNRYNEQTGLCDLQPQAPPLLIMEPQPPATSWTVPC